ncbi:MAG: GNAT family N-acetyltransferase [Gemmataceae bacterium]|nr:GNAT family N-acetyltransferase [Gemmataceae bacterium]
MLPPEEWHRLPDDAARAPNGQIVWRFLDPATTSIQVVEAEGRIVGTVALMQVVHAEVLWIDPAYRRQGGVMRRLLAGLYRGARDRGASVVWAGALVEDMVALLYRLGGVKVPGFSYLLPVREGR